MSAAVGRGFDAVGKLTARESNAAKMKHGEQRLWVDVWEKGKSRGANKRKKDTTTKQKKEFLVGIPMYGKNAEPLHILFAPVS